MVCEISDSMHTFHFLEKTSLVEQVVCPASVFLPVPSGERVRVSLGFTLFVSLQFGNSSDALEVKGRTSSSRLIK